MGFHSEEKTAKLRAKAEIARAMARVAMSAPEYALNHSDVVNNQKTTFKALKNPREYSAGTVYAMAQGNGCVPLSIVGDGEIKYDAVKNVPPAYTTYSTSTSVQDVSGITMIRGYLQPHTLREYCTAKNIPESASRLYLNASGTSRNVSSSFIEVYDITARKPAEEFPTYADKIVPVITWYYTDATGERVSTRQNLSFWYFYTDNQSAYYKYKREQVPFGGGYVDSYISTSSAYNTLYYGVAPPYISTSNSVSNTGNGLSLNGAIYVDWINGERRVYQNINPSPVYTMLGLDFPSLSKTTELYPIEGAINSGVPYTSHARRRIPVFDSVDNIINLFADFGVVVTTDWDEVLNPTPTPEESEEPNPDPSDREIENNPDNSTDTTPIEGAYITPSTFANSCVYTPTTTRDFLRWICNNTVDIGNWSRLFANPVDVITGINLYNLDIVAHDSGRVSYNEQTNILGVTTGIPNYSILDGYNNIIDGGTLHLTAYYGNYADFTSMTYQAFLPFVGFVSLRACDVVNRTLHLYYAVDFATGAAVAFLNSDDKLIYTSPCTVAGKIPISTSDKNSQMINNTLSVIGGIGGLLGGIASGNVGGGVGSFLGGMSGLQFQTNYANKGSLSAVNMYKLLPAFVERTRYDLFLPSDDSNYINARYQSYAGAPSTRFDTLINCVNAGGFVQSDVVYLTSQTATETEKQQIIELIKSGIYL